MDLQPADFPPITLDSASLSATHTRLDVSPAGRDDLAFGLMLPNGWKCGPESLAAPGDGRQWTPLAVYAEKESSRLAIVAVLWRKLDVEVPLHEWAAHQMAGLNVGIVTFRLCQDRRGPVVDVGGVCVGQILGPGPSDAAGTTKSAVKSGVRVAVRCDGQDALMVLGMCEHESYPQVAQDLAIAAASFQLKRPASSIGLEALRQVSGEAPAFSVRCPMSWTHEGMPQNLRQPGKSALNLILAPGGSLDGFVRVKAIDLRVVTDLTMDQLLKDATEELAQGSVALSGGWKPSMDPVIRSTPQLKAALVADGLVKQAPYEFHFGVVQRAPLLFCVTAIVAAPKTDAMACMRGRRAYGLALVTVKPQ